MTFTIVAATLLLFLQTARGSIEGTVLTTAGKPVAGAQVTLLRTPAPPAGTATVTGGGGLTGVIVGAVGEAGGFPNRPTPTTTDATGHFRFAELEPANYLVQAMADGYARQQVGPPPAGQTGMSTSVNITAGQSGNVILHLTPAGTVSGRVTGGNGEPLVGMDVSLIRVTYSAGGRRNVSQFASPVQTNDRGEYRLFWATPGRYYLSISPSSRPVGIGPIGGTPQSRRYPQTFYPGVTNITGASEIDVPQGGELSGIDVRLQQQPVFRVRGKVVDPNGQVPPSASISITPREQISGGVFSTSSPYNPSDGSFELRDVIPGSYWVRAQLPAALPPTADNGRRLSRPLTGIAAVDVSASDVDNVTIAILPPTSISGRVRFEAQSVPQPNGVRVSLQPAAPGPFFGGFPQPAQINTDGTFSIADVGPGDYRVAVSAVGPILDRTNPGPTFYIRQASFGGVDVLKEPLSISGVSSAELQIVVASDSGQVTGRVLTDGQPQTQTLVLLVPDQTDRQDLYRTAPADGTGNFTIRNVPPGSFRAFALDASAMQSFYDPVVMQKLLPSSKPVIVGASQTVTLDLRVSP